MFNFRDSLTYSDLGGRRKLRLYVSAALIIAVILAGVFIFGQAQQTELQAVVEATPHPVSQALLPVSPTPTLVGPASLTPGECPQNPAQWTLVEVFPGHHYQRLEPPCVVESLAKTVAWHMLERLGFTKREAAETLGFEEMPWQPVQEITGLTATQGPRPLALTMEWAAHPEYRYWAVEPNGTPALTYSLRGCYRTRAITGDQTEAWDTRYPVLCVVAYDRNPGWVVNLLGEHRLAFDLTGEPPLRKFALFGYTGVGWVLLGEQEDQQASYPADGLFEERLYLTQKYGTVPWGAGWLEQTFGVTMHPLPEGWQTFGQDPAEVAAMAGELDKALSDFGGAP